MKQEPTIDQLRLPFYENDYQNFRPIHYLGSKLRILEFIENAINDLDSSKGRVCDLFAGSGTVSYKLSQNREVTAVDIQKYSSVLCSALLTPNVPSSKIINEFLERCETSEFTTNLLWAINSLSNYEKQSLLNSLNSDKNEQLCDIIENGSLISYEIQKTSSASDHLFSLIKETYKRLDAAKVSSNESLALRYFGGVYFSYFQSCQIDIILNQIKKVPVSYQNYFRASLLSTVSEIVNTVGKQFAQPLRPRNSKGEIKSTLGKLANKDRSLNTLMIYKKWLQKYSQVKRTKFDHVIINSDFSIALDRLDNDVNIIYADPPYTRDHYSRFYHVLETLVMEDLPKISTMKLKGEILLSRGLYREDRHQSPFCIKSQAPSAFEEIFHKTKKNDAKLVLSYSPYDKTKNSHPRVVTLDELLDIAKKYFVKVEILSAGEFSHSKLNSADNHKVASNYAEVLILAH